MSVIHSTAVRPPVSLKFDSAELGCDLPRDFGIGILPDVIAAFEPEPDPVRDALRALQYTPAAISEALDWIDRHGTAEGCLVLDHEDWPAIDQALAAPGAALSWSEWTDRVSFRPTPEDRGEAARLFESGGYGKRLGLIPSAVAENRRDPRFS